MSCTKRFMRGRTRINACTAEYKPSSSHLTLLGFGFNMKSNEIVLMAMITMTMGESREADDYRCDEMGGATSSPSLGLSQEADLTNCQKQKKKRGSKMASRLAKLNSVDDEVLEKQAELLGWEQPADEGDRAIELGKMVGKMMSFHKVRTKNIGRT